MPDTPEHKQLWLFNSLANDGEKKEKPPVAAPVVTGATFQFTAKARELMAKKAAKIAERERFLEARNYFLGANSPYTQAQPPRQKS